MEKLRRDFMSLGFDLEGLESFKFLALNPNFADECGGSCTVSCTNGCSSCSPGCKDGK